ncbi:MAG TPA: NADH-quinone oxidoreductase subunit NuoE [Aggregatilineales bacterium]|nr:NADH-quinone oxidoreductase subunit NuoE [Aggregatilineales bacterium]
MSLLERRRADIEHHLSKYPDRTSAIMPILYIAQEEYGYITEEAMEEVAELVGVSPTHVKGVVGFYTMYYDKPKGKYLLYICTDLPCALRGAEQFSEHVCKYLNVEPGGTTEDGLFTVEEVMCIGACDRAPVMQVDFHFHENMTEEKAEKLIEDLRREHEALQPYRKE